MILNFKIVVNELPNTSWSDPQVIIMIVTLVATCGFSYLLWKTSERNADIAKEALDISDNARLGNKEQYDVLRKLKRQEVFESVSKIQNVLFDFASCDFNTFRSRWISEIYEIGKPSLLDLSQNFSEGEIAIINRIFTMKDEFIKENLLKPNGELKPGFNGNELNDAIRNSKALYTKIELDYDELKPRN